MAASWHRPRTGQAGSTGGRCPALTRLRAFDPGGTVSVIETLEHQQHQVGVLRADLANVQSIVDFSEQALDRADAALERATVVVEQTRRRAPRVALVVGAVAVVAAVAVVVWRRRGAKDGEAG
jgi:hypothetical protein